jgi:hypothetical protein
MSTRDDLQQVIDGIQAGRILETCERFHADDVVMSENGAEERIGKDANREYERAFVEGATFHAASVGRVLVDGDGVAVEWTLEFTTVEMGTASSRASCGIPIELDRTYGQWNELHMNQHGVIR